MAQQQVLPFEKDIHAMEELLARLEAKQGDQSASTDDEIRRIRRELASLTRKTYSNLTPWDTVPFQGTEPAAKRSITSSSFSAILLNYMANERLATTEPFAPDSRGWATIRLSSSATKKATISKSGTSVSSVALIRGYRKALRCMKMAAKYGLPVICFIDTPGAYPGIERKNVARLS